MNFLKIASSSLQMANRANSLMNNALRMASTVRPLGPKNKMPTFKGTAVVDGEFKVISDQDYNGKWVVMFFYPLDFTFVCPTEIIAFSEKAKEFKALGAEAIACSCDSQFSHLAWINTPRKKGGLGNMEIPVLSDFSKDISRSFGVLDEDSGLSYRGLFIIDPKGNIRHASVNDLPVGRSVSETIRLLKAFKFVDEHGEVCPAEWEEGKDTIKPSEATKYFEKANK
uniref:thioredoxin-dependent peroxiredoxin n=1 Tax=Parastrongyloides trichosuri TaxID=131310 RepID=A0A0N5A759_PARTI